MAAARCHIDIYDYIDTYSEVSREASDVRCGANQREVSHALDARCKLYSLIKKSML
jgi:hypothetical protein